METESDSRAMLYWSTGEILEEFWEKAKWTGNQGKRYEYSDDDFSKTTRIFQVLIYWWDSLSLSCDLEVKVNAS